MVKSMLCFIGCGGWYSGGKGLLMVEGVGDRLLIELLFGCFNAR